MLTLVREGNGVLVYGAVQRMQSICRKPSGYPAAQKRGNRSEEVVEGHRGKAAEKQTFAREGNHIQRAIMACIKLCGNKAAQRCLQQLLTRYQDQK